MKPMIVELPASYFVGITVLVPPGDPSGFSAAWGKFGPQMGSIPGRVGTSLGTGREPRSAEFVVPWVRRRPATGRARLVPIREAVIRRPGIHEEEDDDE